MDERKFIPTRRSLLSRLKDWDDQDSWRDFFDTYWRLIYDFAVRAGLEDAQAQDAVQETIISVAHQMHGFKYDPSVGTFKSWLLQIARRRVADQMRQRYRAGEVGALPAHDPAVAEMVSAVPEPGLDMEVVWEEEWRKHMAQIALEKVKRRVRPEQFQMFDFSVLQRWPVRKVAEALGASVTQVYMARHRVGKLIKKEMQHLERKMV